MVCTVLKSEIFAVFVPEPSFLGYAKGPRPYYDANHDHAATQPWLSPGLLRKAWRAAWTVSCAAKEG